MSYGTPSDMAELEGYYTHIRRGQPPHRAQLVELGQRYQAIGGLSPLRRITFEQARRIAAQLNRGGLSRRFEPFVGFKHAAPFIEDAVREMSTRGISEAVAVVMAPHYSVLGIQPYLDRATAAARAMRLAPLRVVKHWHDRAPFTNCWARRLGVVLSAMTQEQRQTAAVVFSAHSLPKRAGLTDDPYSTQIAESAHAIAAQARVARYEIGWQSAGRTAEQWLEPDIRDITRRLARTGRCENFIYCPIGFVADHLEVLYDNDIECRAVVQELGGRYLRPPMPNADGLFLSALTQAIEDRLAVHAPVVGAA